MGRTTRSSSKPNNRIGRCRTTGSGSRRRHEGRNRKSWGTYRAVFPRLFWAASRCLIAFFLSIGTLGVMPSSASLSGLPVISVGVTSTSMRPDDVGSSTATTIPTVGMSLVWSHRGSQQSAIGLTRIQGVYVGAGNSPVSAKLAEKICRWDFVDMADMLPEVRLGDREGEPEKLLPRRPRCVTDIWSWLHCYGTYMSVLGPSFPEAIPELMGYMSLIIRCSQDYEGLAWVQYDMAYRRQAAASGNHK